MKLSPFQFSSPFSSPILASPFLVIPQNLINFREYFLINEIKAPEASCFIYPHVPTSLFLSSSALETSKKKFTTRLFNTQKKKYPCETILILSNSLRTSFSSVTDSHQPPTPLFSHLHRRHPRARLSPSFSQSLRNVELSTELN